MGDETHREGSVTTHDGLTLHHRAWAPEGEPRGAVLLVHGLGEHSGRYGHVAGRLLAAGYTVHAFDHRGHGRSDGKRAYVRSYDEYMADMVLYRSHVEREHPGVPLVLLGHSMGGNLVMGHALDHQTGLAGIALSGPALQAGDELSPGKIKIFQLVAKVAPGFRPEGLDATAISRDPAVVDAYLADPLVYDGKISAGLGAALLGAMERFPARYWSLELPILIQHGVDDRLASIEGSRALERGAVNAAVTTHYYEGLHHEIFNEPEQATVLDDLVAWLDQVTG